MIRKDFKKFSIKISSKAIESLPNQILIQYFPNDLCIKNFVKQPRLLNGGKMSFLICVKETLLFPCVYSYLKTVLNKFSSLTEILYEVIFKLFFSIFL